jgi:hypothetical protein
MSQRAKKGVAKRSIAKPNRNENMALNFPDIKKI